MEARNESQTFSISTDVLQVLTYWYFVFICIPFGVTNKRVLLLNILVIKSQVDTFVLKVHHAWFLTITSWPVSNFGLFLLIFGTYAHFWCISLRCFVWCFLNLESSSKPIFSSLIPWNLLLLVRWDRHPSDWSHPNIRKNGSALPLLPENVLQQ